MLDGLKSVRCRRSYAELRTSYAAPYQLLRERSAVVPKSVLVIGAGTGNDVRVALPRRLSASAARGYFRSSISGVTCIVDGSIFQSGVTPETARISPGLKVR